MPPRLCHLMMLVREARSDTPSDSVAAVGISARSASTGCSL